MSIEHVFLGNLKSWLDIYASHSEMTQITDKIKQVRVHGIFSPKRDFMSNILADDISITEDSYFEIVIFIFVLML